MAISQHTGLLCSGLGHFRIETSFPRAGTDAMTVDSQPISAFGKAKGVQTVCQLPVKFSVQRSERLVHPQNPKALNPEYLIVLTLTSLTHQA